MTITPKTIALVMLAGSMIFFLWAFTSAREVQNVQTSASEMPKNAYKTKESSEANVSISVTPRVLFLKEKPVFDITFETHSVDLVFDVASIAILEDQNRNSFGNPEWDGSPPGGHHRNGTLSFSEPLPQSTKQVTITLKGIAGIAKRTFAWEVKRL